MKLGVHLLDTNVLIALFDPLHVHHDSAHQWFEHRRTSSWATCPVTEKGFVRIVSHPRYTNVELLPTDAAAMMRQFCSEASGHVFIGHDVSFLDERIMDFRFITSHKRVTDAYLLATAVNGRATLATFDRGIDYRCVKTAAPGSIIAIAA